MSLILALAAASALQPMPSAAAVHRYGALTLSPDGTTITTIEAASGSSHAVITLRDPSGKIAATADPCADCRYASTIWSPDGKALAFLAQDKANKLTLYVLESGKTRIVTTTDGLADDPQWSPDGKTISLLSVPHPHKLVGATQSGARQVGEIGIASATDEQQIAVVAAAGGDLKTVTPIDTWVYEYSWLNDSSGFAATAAKGDGDNNWWTARLERFSLNGGETVIAAPKMQINEPKTSADGKSIYFIGGLMSDFGSVGGDVYTVSLSGGEPINLTPGFKGSFNSLTVTRAGLMGTAVIGGGMGVARIGVAPGQVEVLLQGETSGNYAFDASGVTAAVSAESITVPASISYGPIKALKTITHDNDGVTTDISARSVTWTNEGFTVQGWLIGPATTEPGKTYPMITVVHGGPSAAVVPRFTRSGTAYNLAKAGYYVFQPNPRGSYGQGEAFVLSNRRDFGGGDLRDILAGIDAVEKQVPVDDKRLGIMGHSYGGLMTMWTVTHSNRFKAAVAGAGIANWSSYYGENGIDQWMIPFFGASFYDDPAIYDKLSPIRYIKDAKTPTFIYVGERDVECPAAQSLEFWHGLKAMGVDTSLVIYEDEGHGIRKPEHQKDQADRTTAWFAKYLK